MEFQDTLEFLTQFRWVYDFPLTAFIGLRIWEQMPREWLDVLTRASIEELNSIPFGKFSAEWPLTLQNFITQAVALPIARDLSPTLMSIQLKSSHKKGMSPKKIHEVSFMAGVVHEICLKNKCMDVIDVGSGLGYLGIALSEQFGYNMLGLESVQSRSHGASDRASTHSSAFSAVEFELADTEESQASFSELIKSQSAKNVNNWCMMGLHCCGDLTPTMLRVFARSPSIRCLAVLSCCYHRMSSKDGRYAQFPMSEKLQKDMATGRWSANTFALRLAAQETRMRWRNQSHDDHEYHSKNVAYRSLVELADLKLEKRHRKIARPSHFTDFEVYLDNLLERTTFAEGDVDHCRNILQDLHEKHQECFAYIEPFTCLQVAMQPVLESLIIQDRLMFLTEQPGIHAEVVPIFDENVSPRNLAILAWKEPT